MAVKILIRRKFKEGALNQVSSMLIKARTNAMGNKGYISTDTLVDHDDSLSILIISMRHIIAHRCLSLCESAVSGATELRWYRWARSGRPSAQVKNVSVLS